jgi:formylglycine-generating enzyme required for sulfatase activity
MPFHLGIDGEPIPGYRLVRRLGRGGFGEVWLAQAPGSFSVAFKFVCLDTSHVKPELRALELLRSIRHPHLLDVQFAVKNDGWLVIAMPLCDRSLADRFEECCQQGLSGIPHEELLGYISEAAQALDFLNEPRHQFGDKHPVGVQHRDVKPQNLLLVGGSVRVADFGLAKVLDGIVVSHSGGMTLAYAAPELLQGKVSAATDQFSLSATYVHLATGRLPFGSDTQQILGGLMTGKPDLERLPEQERPIVARALAKDPRDRWPTCREFVHRLADGAPRDRVAPPTLAPTLHQAVPPPPPVGISPTPRSSPERVPQPVPADLPLIDSPSRARQEQSRLAALLNLETSWATNLGIHFRLIPAGRFCMGAVPGDRAAEADEHPRRSVRIELPFWAAVFPLTNALVREFLDSASPADDPCIAQVLLDRSFAGRSRRGGLVDELPAVDLSARDAEALCAWMRLREARDFRLPTEAEWEYLARAGSMGLYWWDDAISPNRSAVFAVRGPAAPDDRRANAWGLIDTLGNVEEWTSSVYNALDSGAATQAASDFKLKKLATRGGSWREQRVERLRLSRRQALVVDARVNYVGIRVVCSVERPKAG